MMDENIKNKVFDQITRQVELGHNVMLCAPRRSGKTYLLIELLNTSLSDKKVFYISPSLAQRKQVSLRTGREIKGCTFRSLNNIRGIDVDCVIVEEPVMVKPEKFNEMMSLIYPIKAQIIFLFSPFEYESSNPHPLKVLWDTAPYFKYQISAGILGHYKEIKKQKDSFSTNEFQTEVEGNWVAI